MSNKTNLAFFNAYLELDKACAQALEISKSGVSSYINCLVESRYAPDRNEVLRKLIKYRKFRNIIAHEAGAMTEFNEITKEDIKWVNKFASQMIRKQDPISKYERKLKRREVWQKVRVGLIIAGVVIVLVGGVVLYTTLK